jgi:voltage-gated potassium channel
VASIFWIFEKDHIKDDVDVDNDKGEFSYIDSLYFTIVSVTTVGYGDIVPITEEARMFDALIITPVRIIVWVTFIGTAYQLVFQRRMEAYRMDRALKKMKGHVIIAGCGTTGAATVEELIHYGYNEENMVVIDTNDENVKTAAEVGATGIVGDPSKEEILTRAGIQGAKALIITTSQDDSNVLITLTAKDLSPKVLVVSRVSQQENIKQLKRAGANVIISPALTGGHMMAMAVSKSTTVELVEELLTTSRGANILQRYVKDSEVGKSPKNLKGFVVLGVVRGGKTRGPKDLDGITLKKGDEIILVG